MLKRQSTLLKLIGVAILALIAGGGLVHTFLAAQPSKLSGTLGTPLTYPPFTKAAISLPDTLQYFYCTHDYRGQALSTGDFFVYLKYPVFRLAAQAAKRYETWLLDQVFTLGSNAEEEEILSYKKAKDIPAYAQSCLNSWLSGEETQIMGCLQDSLAVEVALNSELVTLSVTKGGYWGGAHGDASQQHYMFDRDFNPVDPYSVFEPSQVDGFKELLISEYDRQVDPWQEYGEEYKLNPDSFALVPKGIIAHYFGWSNAEGKPVVFIETNKFNQFLKPKYQDMYRKLSQPKVEDDE